MPKMHYKRAIMSDRAVEAKMAMLAKCREFVPPVYDVPKKQPKPKPVPKPVAPAVPATPSMPRMLPPTVVTFN